MLSGQDKCQRCGKDISDSYDTIEAEEIIVCEGCANKHKRTIIADLDKFRQTNKFKDIIALRKKIIDTSASLGNLFDNATGTLRESVSDYDSLNLFELQSYILDIELTCIEDLLRDDNGLLTIKDSKLQRLRQEVLQEHKRILSYTSRGEE